MNAVVAADVQELFDEIQRLQKALNFWLPSVPVNGPQEVVNRIAHDAHLLAGYNELEVPEEQDAEQLGWIKLTGSASNG